MFWPYPSNTTHTSRSIERPAKWASVVRLPAARADWTPLWRASVNYYDNESKAVAARFARFLYRPEIGTGRIGTPRSAAKARYLCEVGFQPTILARAWCFEEC